MVYILALSFQLSGAVVLFFGLLIKYIKEGPVAIAKNCCPKLIFVNMDKNHNYCFPKENVQQSAQEIYLNIAAFANLVLGYLFAIFGVLSYSLWLIAMLVIFISLILILMELYGAKWLAKHNYQDDVIIPAKNLTDYNIYSVAEDEEVGEMLDEIYGSKETES